MRVLVTGASGLLGFALKRVPSAHTMVFATRHDADLRNFSEAKGLIQNVNPDAIIHAAALVGGIGGNLMKSGNFFFENSQINLNVLEAARQNDVRNVVSFMSTCVFPDKTDFPLKVGTLHDGPPHESNFGYAYSKRMLEVQSRAYNQQWDSNFKVIVPANMFGPGDNFSLTEGHVIPALIHKIFTAQKERRALEVWGTGTPLREFIFSYDVASVTLQVLEMNLPDPLIVSTSSEVSIESLVREICNLVGFENEVVFDQSKPDGQFRKPSDAAAFNSLFPSFDFTPLRKGLEETVNWFTTNYPRIRK